jgi:hypothetical protein
MVVVVVVVVVGIGYGIVVKGTRILTGEPKL